MEKRAERYLWSAGWFGWVDASRWGGVAATKVLSKLFSRASRMEGSSWKMELDPGQGRSTIREPFARRGSREKKNERRIQKLHCFRLLTTTATRVTPILPVRINFRSADEQPTQVRRQIKRVSLLATLEFCFRVS